MRELSIRFNYDPGVNPVADIFIGHPELILESIDITVDNGIIRVDHVTGTGEALDQLKDTFLDETICNECVIPHDQCDAERSYKILSSEPTSLTLYTYHEQVTYCHSVPYHAAVTLQPGTLYNAMRRRNETTWRVLLRDDENTTDLYDALANSLPEGVSMTFQHLTTPKHWGPYSNRQLDLPPEQRATIERAVELSYYDYPRGIDLGDLAADLDIPRSTARYRLRRAENALTNAYLAD